MNVNPNFLTYKRLVTLVKLQMGMAKDGETDSDGLPLAHARAVEIRHAQANLEQLYAQWGRDWS